MRISDWSSDVCSSDLVVDVRVAVAEIVPEGEIDRVERAVGHAVGAPGGADVPAPAAIGIATHPHEEALVPRLAVLHRLEARSEEHTSELQSLMRISYAVFCLKKQKLHNYNDDAH